MRTGLKVARIFGIGIYVDWSWLFIFALITWNLDVVFGQMHRAWGAWFTLGIAAAAAILFFLSVLAHELAHSLVARAHGVPVRNITLFIFGGVSNIQREPESPGTEFLFTIVGPLTSVALGVLFTWLGLRNAGLANTPAPFVNVNPLGTMALLDPLSTLLLWLGPINVLVGLFNLIPAFPLDGGRILRSILWAASGNLLRATRWATAVGQVIAWLFILAGIAMVFGFTIPYFGTGLISGLWLAFIGWFLNSAAVQSYRQVVVEDILEGVPVRRIMRPNPPTVPSNVTVSDLIQNYVMGTDDHAFPVVDDGRVAGMVTLENVRQVPRDARDTTVVRDIMTPADKLVTATPEEDAADAMNKLAQRDVNQLPVVNRGELVGLLRRRDIVRWLQVHSELKLG